MRSVQSAAARIAGSEQLPTRDRVDRKSARQCPCQSAHLLASSCFVCIVCYLSLLMVSFSFAPSRAALPRIPPPARQTMTTTRRIRRERREERRTMSSKREHCNDRAWPASPPICCLSAPLHSSLLVPSLFSSLASSSVLHLLPLHSLHLHLTLLRLRAFPLLSFPLFLLTGIGCCGRPSGSHRCSHTPRDDNNHHTHTAHNAFTLHTLTLHAHAVAADT